MSAETGIAIQQQIRENSDDLQNAIKDLHTWEKEMKKKEEAWKLLQVCDDQAVPPIRNVLSRSKSRHKKIKENVSPKKERLLSYDYKAWEKFDVDSELKKLDDEKKDSSGSDSSDKEEAMCKQKNQQLALIKKDKGNDFFKRGNYDSAINCYTIGMELDPENPLLPANRAMAFLKKEQFQAAENDCTLCLSLDPSYVKAYLRRGTARNALQKPSLAESDFLKALELEPDNKQAQMELEKLHEETKFVKNSFENQGRIHQESNKNIIIDSMEQGEGDSMLEEHTFKSLDSDPCNSHGYPGNIEESFTKLSVTNMKSDDFRELLANQFALDASELKRGSKPSGDSTNAIQLQNSDDMARAEVEWKPNGIDHIITRLEQSLPPVPSASFQFLNDWKKIEKYPNLKYQYLKQFPPEKLPVLFKYSMEAEIFPGILQTLSTSFIENGDDVFDYMKFLALVGRFNTMLLFLSENEQQDLHALSSYVKASGYTSSEVETLLKLYKMS